MPGKRPRSMSSTFPWPRSTSSSGALTHRRCPESSVCPAWATPRHPRAGKRGPSQATADEKTRGGSPCEARPLAADQATADITPHATVLPIHLKALGPLAQLGFDKRVRTTAETADFCVLGFMDEHDLTGVSVQRTSRGTRQRNIDRSATKPLQRTSNENATTR